MSRMEQWEHEAAEARRNEIWKLTGPQRPIKVCPAEWTVATHVTGYFTMGQYLFGKTPAQLEKILGFPTGYLKHGARLYKFARLPQATEYCYELTTAYPDGLADMGPLPKKIYYPAGSRTVHQWTLLKGQKIRVNPMYYTIRPTFTLPYSWLNKD